MWPRRSHNLCELVSSPARWGQCRTSIYSIGSCADEMRIENAYQRHSTLPGRSIIHIVLKGALGQPAAPWYRVSEAAFAEKLSWLQMKSKVNTEGKRNPQMSTWRLRNCKDGRAILATSVLGPTSSGRAECFWNRPARWLTDVSHRNVEEGCLMLPSVTGAPGGLDSQPMGGGWKNISFEKGPQELSWKAGLWPLLRLSTKPAILQMKILRSERWWWPTCQEPVGPGLNPDPPNPQSLPFPLLLGFWQGLPSPPLGFSSPPSPTPSLSPGSYHCGLELPRRVLLQGWLWHNECWLSWAHARDSCTRSPGTGRITPGLESVGSLSLPGFGNGLQDQDR